MVKIPWGPERLYKSTTPVFGCFFVCYEYIREYRDCAMERRLPHVVSFEPVGVVIAQDVGGHQRQMGANRKIHDPDIMCPRN